MNTLNSDFHYNQALLQWLNNLSDLGIFTTDHNLKIQSWNHWLETYSGYSAHEVIGKNLLEIYPEIQQRGLDQFYQQALEGQIAILSQRLHRYLLPMYPTLSREKSVQMQQSSRIAPLNQGNQIIGTITVIEDVSERVERETELQNKITKLELTEAALRSTQNQLEQLLTSSPAVLYTCKSSGDFSLRFVSGNIFAQLGYYPQEWLENPDFWQENLHPEDRLDVLCEKTNLLSKEHQILEYRFRHKDGHYRWLRDEMKVVYNPEGNIQEFVGILSDITQQKQIQAKIMEQAALLDVATDAILVQNLSSQILFWNKAAERLYGWTAKEALQKNITDLFTDSNVLEFIEAQDITLETGSWEGELLQITKDNTKVLVSSRWTLVKDERDRPKSILIVNTDITEKKKLEAQFLRAQRMESIGTLASGIAHDLNNILTPILAAVQMFQRGVPENKYQVILNLLETNTKRGANLVKQVLSFAKGLEGKPTRLQVKHIIYEIADIARATFPKSIEVSLDIPKNLGLIFGDPTQIHQVLMNLCVNARDAMPDGGKLTIVAENVSLTQKDLKIHWDAQVGDYVMISIADTGMGISPEVLDRIFEPFFTTKEMGKGTGLGLSTVLGILKSHHGFINVESQLGQGTIFQVYFPINQDAEIQEKIASQSQCFGNGSLVLVVDDEAPIREITKSSLENNGYQVLVASDGLEAIDLYSQHRTNISCVILDMMMPSMDGRSTIISLQRINPHIKIIAISGLGTTSVKETLANLGVTSFLAKPYTSEELLKILQTKLS
jgi:two-component system, cell cycle sensor histidine kinase and response regulator CckA